MSSDVLKSTLFNSKVLQIEFKNTKKGNALSINMLDKLYKILSYKKN